MWEQSIIFLSFLFFFNRHKIHIIAVTTIALIALKTRSVVQKPHPLEFWNSQDNDWCFFFFPLNVVTKHLCERWGGLCVYSTMGCRLSIWTLQVWNSHLKDQRWARGHDHWEHRVKTYPFEGAAEVQFLILVSLVAAQVNSIHSNLSSSLMRIFLLFRMSQLK